MIRVCVTGASGLLGGNLAAGNAQHRDEAGARFGRAEDGRDIASEIRSRMWPSLALALPVLLVGLAVNISFALLMAFFRATYLDFWGVVLCVAMMSISGQYYECTAIMPGACSNSSWNLTSGTGCDGV